jgi:hypothetical protein
MRRFFTVSFISTLTIGIAYFLPISVWAEFGGLPAHPLIIHGVVVLLPLVAIMLLVGLFWKNLLKELHLPIIGVLALSVVAAASVSDIWCSDVASIDPALVFFAILLDTGTFDFDLSISESETV